MSYAGRLTLVNSVLNTLHNYWGSIFLIPKSIIKRIEAVYRNFFWDRGTEYNRAPLVAWHTICTSKKEEGLGVRNAELGNAASVGKLVNWIYTKADRIWVLWVDHVYLKGQDWNSYEPPPDSNWNWRNICKTRKLMAMGYVGDQWTLYVKGYTVKAGYQLLQGQHPPVQWYKEVWDSWFLPKHSIIGWLIKHEALNLRDKLHRLNICESNMCVICEKETETHQHLFTRCEYSRSVVLLLDTWLSSALNGNAQGLSNLMNICRMIQVTVWYTLWMERNKCRLYLAIRRPEILVKEIKSFICMRVKMMMQVQWPVSNEHSFWLRLSDTV
ncbi:uncharacterized protein LOC141629547 [Silene latifolia]|uniref:uncharacterized protein LOC141629547 n=1 Tax=Silene latifolia TaxID=37657 RepID=UPI003D77BD9B